MQFHWEYYFKLLSEKPRHNTILNRSKDFYENDQERLREQARDKYRNLSEEKNKKRECRKNRYLNVWRKEKKD